MLIIDTFMVKYMCGEIMFKKINILDEKDKNLRIKCTPYDRKLNKTEIELIEQIKTQLRFSQIEEYEKKYNLRPGMGLAFPQVGIAKRLIVIVHEYEKGKFDEFVVINPKIISHSEEMIASEYGEGCLSVNREIEGHVPRYARVTIKGLNINSEPIKIRAREELSIAFQHEIDHLNGILFFDRINKKKPFFADKEIRLI